MSYQLERDAANHPEEYYNCAGCSEVIPLKNVKINDWVVCPECQVRMKAVKVDERWLLLRDGWV